MKSILRRIALNTALAGGAVLATNHLSVTVNQVQKKKKDEKESFKGNIRHSVSKWYFDKYPL